MDCRYHKDTEAKYICDKCKQPICEECSVDVKGRKLCASCIEKSLSLNADRHYKDGFFERLAFFCLSCVPGASQMYMNLFKRGFQLMLGFMGSIVLFSYINTEAMILMVAIPLWFFSFFDGYAIRRRIRAGEIVDDITVLDYEIAFRNKRIAGIVMLVLGVLGITNTFQYSLWRNVFGEQFYWVVKRSIVPVALTLTGIYILKRTKKPEKEGKNSIEENNTAEGNNIEEDVKA